jgi:hypothetical protein
MNVKIRVCLPRKYDRVMLLIDNNWMLPGARLRILNNIYRKLTIIGCCQVQDYIY